MNKITLFLGIVLFLFSCQAEKNSTRNEDFNFNWKFSLEVDSSAIKPEYDDKNWKAVNLPHDWSIEFPFDTIKGEGCTGYLPGGTGWYRKTFDINISENEKVSVLFDGIYNNSEVWLNGKKLGERPYGYSPFFYELTPFLTKDGKNNVITVKVDRTRFADSRWYSGSGIYRDVKLITTDKLNIPIWGTFITTPKISNEKATIKISTKVNNNYAETKEFELETKILSPEGKLISSAKAKFNIGGAKTDEFAQEIKVENPELWNTESPVLYTAISEISLGGKIIDSYETVFGIRSINFDTDKGFFLNGENMKIKGVCLHHDVGLVGAAVPEGVWKRRLEILKDGGCNAIRISHNPASEVLLKLCDEMGFLVQDEFFDEWDYPKDKRLNMNQTISTDYVTRGYTEHFQEWAERDLKNTMLAHRNHPSIIQWSIGNEIEWTYPRNKKATGFWDASWSGNYFWNPTPLTPEEIKQRYDTMPALEHNIGETAQKLSKWTKELDTTRYVTANCILPSASYASGYAEALDIIGFSYRRVMYDYGHEHFPNLPLMGTENLCQWHEWKAIQERDFVSGTFLWTGADYMGEVHQRNPGDVRNRGTASGLIDFASFRKPSFYMYRTLWNENEPTLYISTQSIEKSIYKLDEKTNEPIEKQAGRWERALWLWHNVNEHWNYAQGETVVVEIISNLPEVELFLNGESLGNKKLADFPDRIYKWAVPFTEGKLEAKANFNGKEIVSDISTAKEPAKIEISVDKTELTADGYDVAHITVQVVDKDGNPVKVSEQEINFDISGDVKLLGVDNGDAGSFPVYQSNSVKTSKGKALLIIQSKKKTTEAKITASFGEVKSEEINISVK